MFTRREFLKNSVLLGSAAMFLPACSSAPKPRKIGANEKLNVAVVGCGGRGFETVKAVGALPSVRELKYNPATMSFDSCPEAERLVSSLYDYNPSFLP